MQTEKRRDPASGARGHRRRGREAKGLQKRGERTRAGILEAAEIVFAEHGYAGTSLDAVAAKAGIHKPGICYYFPNKRELYEAVMSEVMRSFETRLDAAFSSRGSPRERLLRSVENWVEGLVARPTAARLILHEVANPDPATVPAAFRGHGDSTDSLIEGAFQKLLPDAHPDDAFNFQCAIAGAALFYATGMQRLQSGPSAPDVSHSMERHKILLLRIARALLRDVRSAS